MTDVTLSRRKLLGAGAGIAAAATLGTRGLGTEPAGAGTEFNYTGSPLFAAERVGIQLYSVRDQISSIGFARVFEALAGIGYKEVEFAGYTQGSVGPITPAQIRQLLDDHGLKGVASHVSVTTANAKQTCDTAKILGLPYVGLASASSQNGTIAGWQAAADNLNAIGAAVAAEGLKFYWHNHSAEFGFTSDQPMTRIYDILLAETDPALVFMQMDIFWAYVGQYQWGRPPFPAFSPVAYVKAHRSRYPLFHVKDGKQNQGSQNGYDMVDVGQGHIDFEAFFCEVGVVAGHHYLYERDNANAHPFGSLVSSKASGLYMKHGLVGC